MTPSQRNNVKIKGRQPAAMLFAHGFGCDQNMWRYVAPAFEADYGTILFDQVGAGHSDLNAFSPGKYETLQGYADDMIDIAREVGLRDAILVGHSVSAMTAALAIAKAPEMFKALIMVAPSPCYINDDDYVGGFTRPQIEELLDFLDSNHLGWSSTMAPLIMGNPERPELAGELTDSFCRTDPDIAKHFARTTFMSDERQMLPHIKVPTLILQCAEDVIAPEAVGAYMHHRIPGSKLVMMEATGHCPNLSAPEETIAAMKAFL